MEDWEDSLRHQIIINSILINLEKLDTDYRKNFPSIKDIISTLSKDPSEYMGSDQKTNDTRKFELAQEQRKARREIQLLNQTFGYRHLEELDEIILQVVDTSLSQSAELAFSKKGDIRNQQEIENKTLQKKMDDLYNHTDRLYNNSFANNEQEIIDGILSFMKENHCQLGITQFEDIERFASMLGLDISIYKKSLLETILKELSENHPYDLISFRHQITKYPDLEASLNDRIKAYFQTLDITTALENIINDDYYFARLSRLNVYIEFLKSCTVDEYCEWLEKGHPELPKMVRWLLDSGYQPASQNLETAICILAECSRINKIRAKYLYNIDIDNQPHPDNP